MSVRVYIPLTSSGVSRVVAEGRIAGPFRAHAVTPALQAEWPEADQEEWEYAATYAAADHSWSLVAEADRPRRFVLAADVPSVTPVPEELTLVEVDADVPWKRVAALHADAEDLTEDTVADAELAWFATQEIHHLV